MKQHIANGVLISTGATGSIDLATRMNNYMCSAIDIIALGDMEVDSNASWDLFEAKFRQAVVNGTIYNKTVILEHFNSCGYRPSKYASLAESLGIAWMIWGVTYNVKTPDCDFYTSTPSLWDLLG